MLKNNGLLKFALPLLFVASYAKADTPPAEKPAIDLSSITEDAPAEAKPATAAGTENTSEEAKPAIDLSSITEDATAGEKAPIDLTSLSVEDLMKVDVTSANKKVQSSTEVPSAIYVLSSEDIHRSGATSVPEALRMVPGVLVQRLDSNKWSVSIRGNTGRFNNKLLVMIDGRTVYNPTFSGVYWEVQDVTLADIQQIEVIRGPGGTIWGANAVNGIINIITKKSPQTQGLLASLIAGNYDQSIADLRYGDTINEQLTYRLYGKYLNRGSFKSIFDENAHDDWNMNRAGMRADWKNENNQFTLSADGYHGKIDQIGPLAIPVPPYTQLFSETVDPSGWNISSRWDRHINDKTNFALQLYYDVAKRKELIALQKQKTLDIDSNLNYVLNETHELGFGLGFRMIKDIDINTPWAVFPGPTTKNTYSGFIQDSISIIPKTLILTVGSKVEHNDYTGVEVQPSARLAWLQEEGNVAWASYTQGVRTPSRVDQDGNVLLAIMPTGGGFGPNVNIVLSGQKDFVSEKVKSYELGYRFGVAKKANIDIAGFYNEYDKLRTNETVPLIMTSLPFIQPLAFQNNSYGHTYGYEIGAQYNPITEWELKLAYANYHQNFKLNDTSNFVDGLFISENNTPRHTFSLFSKYSFAEKWELDVWLKAVDDIVHNGTQIPFPIPGYLTGDVRLAFKPTKNVELALIGQNLNKRKHIEGKEEFPRIPSDVPRAYYVNISYKA